MQLDHIIYTDLDGTLLDLETYSPNTAFQAVQKLKRKEIPIIFCSSKTLEEQLDYQQLLGLNTPMIVENGAGIVIPNSFHPYFLEIPHERMDDMLLFSFSKCQDFIVDSINHIRSELNLELSGYNDLGNAEISELTGLPLESVSKTTNRMFSETIIKGDFKSPDFKKFRLALFEMDLQCTPGSKFFTITGLSSNKGSAIKWLNKHFKKITDSSFSTIGIGDSLNDLPMLAETDKSFLVQKPNETWAKIELPNLVKVDKPGPDGWNKVVELHLGFC